MSVKNATLYVWKQITSFKFLKNIPNNKFWILKFEVRIRQDLDGTRARLHRPARVLSGSPLTLTRRVRATPGRVGRAHACPARAHHDGGSHRGGIHAPTEACAPPMMGRALYKEVHTHTPPHFHLILGLQLHPRGRLLGSWMEVLGPTSTCCHFFLHKLNF
jgi:hypothetical protein